MEVSLSKLDINNKDPWKTRLNGTPFNSELQRCFAISSPTCSNEISLQHQCTATEASLHTKKQSIGPVSIQWDQERNKTWKIFLEGCITDACTSTAKQNGAKNALTTS